MRSFLRRFVPGGLDIDTRFVVDYSGRISRQVDIVIHRNDYHPVLEIGGIKHPSSRASLTVPDLDLDRCIDGNLKSWVAPIDLAEEGDAFYGYTGPGYREEFWILDVDGTRLVIAAERSPGSPPEDLTELRTILDSIRIEP